jgi:hypothetical protein
LPPALLSVNVEFMLRLMLTPVRRFRLKLGLALA